MRSPSLSSVRVDGSTVVLDATLDGEERMIELDVGAATARMHTSGLVEVVPDPQRAAMAALSGDGCCWSEWVSVLARAPGLAGTVTFRTPFEVAAALRSSWSVVTPLPFDWLLPLARLVSTAAVSDGESPELAGLVEIAVVAAVTSGPGAMRTTSTLTAPFGALQCISGTLGLFESVSTSRYEQFSAAIEAVAGAGVSEAVLAGLHRSEGFVRERSLRAAAVRGS